MRKVLYFAAFALVASTSFVNAAEGDYYYRVGATCDTGVPSSVSDSKLLTLSGKRDQSRVRLNLSLLGNYSDEGLAYLQAAQKDMQIAIIEPASKKLMPYSHDHMYIIGKEKLPLSELGNLPSVLAGSEALAKAYQGRVKALSTQWGLFPDDKIIVQTGVRVLIREETNEVFLKSFFTSFDAARIEKNLLTINHHKPMMKSLETAYHQRATQVACAVSL
ncbi:hypothetical protein [Aestuariibacter sp. A3R04]|uniref:hypothetical protein n=1 Tax=Aestuariibacter sp. A3R04 TaxID=2841571 RepID=UPI001C09F596|nr:hypothetical protein [Aestuariibacter sp. A3R04]MBU3021216.1 hypothetical protein [Aestuariibacter sp. A3R04]